MILSWLAWLMVLPQNYWWNLFTHAWLVHALKIAKTSRYLLLAVDPEATPLQKPLGLRDDSERQDFPAQEHFFCPPFAFPAWPAILSVWSAVLLGLCQEELCSSGQQEAQGPLRRCRGQHLLPFLYRQMWVTVALRGLHCAHTSSVYFLHNLDYCYWFMRPGLCLGVWDKRLIYKTRQKKRPSVFLCFDNEWVNAGGP